MIFISITFINLCFRLVYSADKATNITVDHNKGLLKRMEESVNPHANLEQLITDIVAPRTKTVKCFIVLCDDMYCDIFSRAMFKKFKAHVTHFMVHIADYEDLYAPGKSTQEALDEVKLEGCKMYIVLMANGIQVTRFLKYADRYRMINTRANFVMLYDIRLFTKNMHYLWTRIVNIVFIREYGTNSKTKAIPWFDLSTVPFPTPIRNVFIPHRLDTWRKGHFRLGIDLFRDKSSDLKNQILKVVLFQHIPAVTRYSPLMDANSTTENQTIIPIYSGLEMEILQTLAEQMNFQTSLYEPENADTEKWGRKQDGQFSGLLGEMVKFQAEIALGDLYYTPYHLELMDLTIPYNTECLTFLTPESSTDNSWMTLILPFKLYMWITIMIVISVIGFIFHGFAKFQRYLYNHTKEESCIIFENQALSADAEILREKLKSPFKHMPIHKRKMQIVETEKKPEGLYIFEELFNAFLYTYSMLLLISLPKVPDGWSLRVIVGWYFLYTTLVVVSYKASMTSILTNPAPKITIDTLEVLDASNIACGGWAETARDFFLTSLDSTSQKIGRKFEHVNDTDVALEKVARGEFAYYENIYFLKAASVKRELSVQLSKNQDANYVDMDRNLHIMSTCVIKMPISLGLQKNSPIKSKVDTFIRRVIEGGFVKKWLNDVMQTTLTSSMHLDPEGKMALMTLEKLYAGIGALFIGYFISSVVLGVEISYWHFVVKKHPNFDKYSNRIFIPVQREITQNQIK